MAGIVTLLAFAVPVWLCGAVVLPSLLKDPAIRWPLASTLGAALAALAAVWGQGFATSGQGTTGQTPSAPSVQATPARAVAIGGNNQGAISTGDALVPAQPTPAGPATAQPPAPPASPPQTASASGERSITIGGDNSGSLSTGDQPGSAHP
ncbi:hypothetical protein [Kitasatospora azatica]|uniref:hypothetical protein n=1 Tax=Kitasatospora azatica TaxID=58347 RepID=UPI00068A7269|nr:hypothetical protein [Kitasatospora azatica]